MKGSINYETLRPQNKLKYDVTITGNDGRESSTPQQMTLMVIDVNEPQTGFVKAMYSTETGEGKVHKLNQNKMHSKYFTY